MIKKLVRNSVLFSLLLLSMCTNKDIDNVTVTGIVYDKVTEKPISKVKVRIINTFHTKDNDYNQSAIYLIETDEKGRYKKTFSKSASLELKVSKEGYPTDSLSQKVSKNEVKLDFYLKRK